MSEHHASEHHASEHHLSEHQNPGQDPENDASWAPLAHPAFRWLWIGTLVASIGSNMQIVGAQWLLVNKPHAASLVSLVQAANNLPIMLMALPAGVLADLFDRRRILMIVQGYIFVVGMLLAALSAAGWTPAVLVLGFTFAFGASWAVQLPAWQSSIPDLVPRSQLRVAARIDLIAVNTARTLGPALAGLITAYAGVPIVFALNALSVTFLLVALLRWRRGPDQATPSDPAAREPFWAALRTGARFVLRDQPVRRILLRVTLLVTPSAVIWALLPLVASEGLNAGADGYGMLFALLGAGAIAGAFVLGPLRRHLGSNSTIAAASLLLAAMLGILASTSNYPLALGTMFLCGVSWMATTATLMAEMQLALPDWIRARALAVYSMVFCACLVCGSLLWGAVAQLSGLRVCLMASAVAVAGCACLGWARPLTSREPAGRAGTVQPATALGSQLDLSAPVPLDQASASAACLAANG